MDFIAQHFSRTDFTERLALRGIIPIIATASQPTLRPLDAALRDPPMISTDRKRVPAAYIGVWRRTLLATPALRDTTSRVFWLQTERWHADIRIPMDRPAISATARARVDEPVLRQLARQQGFAGTTEVDGDICRWQREVNYQPPGRFADVGRMRFETPYRLLGYGVEQEYFEIWERLPQSEGDTAMIDLTSPPHPRTLLLRSGEFVMHVRDRAASLPAAENFETLAASMDRAQLTEALNLEISFGRVQSEDTWRIELSTLPWLEGRAMPLCSL
jgi:hypothetical protein